MIVYGLRGLAAYAHHAEVLGERDAEVRHPWTARSMHSPRCTAASAARAALSAYIAPPAEFLSLSLSLSLSLTLTHSLSPSPFPCLQVDAFMAKAYAFLCSEDALDLGKVLGMVDEVGAAGVKGMRLLDHGEQVWLRERLLAGEGGGGAGGGGAGE